MDRRFLELRGGCWRSVWKMAEWVVLIDWSSGKQSCADYFSNEDAAVAWLSKQMNAVERDGALVRLFRRRAGEVDGYDDVTYERLLPGGVPPSPC